MIQRIVEIGGKLLCLVPFFFIFGLLIAQAGEPSITSMKMGGGTSQDSGMGDMMGAPGLEPFGIMIGKAGQWMVGYQYMFGKLDGILEGTNNVSPANVLTRFATTPIDMTMQTQMGMIMYAPTDNLTIMAMLPYTAMSMDELHRDGTQSTEQSEGIGDLELKGMYSLYADKDMDNRFLANFGVAFPTGSINLLGADGTRLEYPMQTGSGTFSLLLGFIYLGQALPWGWGADFNSTIRLGSNENGYRLGDRYESRIWIARQLTNWVSLSSGVNGEFWQNITGLDPLLDPTDEPTKDSNMQGGECIDAVLGVTFSPPNGFFKGQQFLIQGELPVIQYLNGPQLESAFIVNVAWQLGF